MSKEGMATQALAGEIAAAVLADENDGGCDISAGLFGPAFSAIIRKIATEYVQTPAAPGIDASPKGGEPVATLTIGDAGEEGTQAYFLDRIRDTEAFGKLPPGTYQLAVCSLQATSAEVGECRCRPGRYGCEPDCPSQQPTSHGAGVSE